MPWTVDDVEEHNAGLSDDLKRQWVEVANDRLRQCLETHAGEVDAAQREQCEGSAIRQANAAVRRAGRSKEQSYTPTQAMVAAARRGLEMRREHNRGGTEIGVARARDISNGKQLSLSTVKRMHSFFSRHEVDKRAEGFRSGEEGYPSAGRIAWDLWGGDAGQSWAQRIVESQEKQMDEKAQTKRIGDQDLPASSFLVVEDRENTETWHLPVKDAQGNPDRGRMGAAWASLHEGYRGNTYEGPQKQEAIRKLRRLYDQVGASPPGEKSVLARVYEYIKALWTEEQKPDAPGLMLWKEADGRYRWIARYSNNLRDRDNPPEIITAQSHRRFVELVDNKEADLPELWLWHVPGTRWGVADWIAYDDTGDVGFTVAGGTVDKGKEPVAEALAALSPAIVRVSHGMPVSSIVRDEADPTLIVEHITREISPLPTGWAANQYTGFSILKEQDEMAIPDEKRQALVQEWGLSEEVLGLIEQGDQAQAEEAKEQGLESKEAEPVEVEAAEAVVKEEIPEAEDAPAVEPLTREEVAEALNAVATPIVQALQGLNARLDALTKDLDALKEADEVKIAEKAELTPAASLMDLLNLRAVGSKAAQIDGRTSLAKSVPAETEPPTPRVTGIPFLDALATGRDTHISAG